MNKINLLKRLLPKILIASLCLISAITFNPFKVHAASYQVGVKTSVNGAYSSSGSTSSAAWNYTDKWVSNNAALNAALTWSGSPSNTSQKIVTGGHYTSHKCSGGCYSFNVDGKTVHSAPRTLNDGWVNDYTTYYYTAHNSTASFTPTVEMNGATITYQVLNGSTVVYSKNYTVELNLTPSISTGLKETYSSISHNSSTDLAVTGYLIDTYTWQVKKKDSSTWQNITEQDTQFSGIGTEKLTFTPQNLDYNEAEIKVIGTNSYVATTAESSTKLFLNIETFTPKISSKLTTVSSTLYSIFYITISIQISSFS